MKLPLSEASKSVASNRMPFVALPFGEKKDGQGNEIDFNRVFVELVKPALQAARLEVVRAGTQSKDRK